MEGIIDLVEDDEVVPTRGHLLLSQSDGILCILTVFLEWVRVALDPAEALSRGMKPMAAVHLLQPSHSPE